MNINKTSSNSVLIDFNNLIDDSLVNSTLEKVMIFNTSEYVNNSFHKTQLILTRHQKIAIELHARIGHLEAEINPAQRAPVWTQKIPIIAWIARKLIGLYLRVSRKFYLTNQKIEVTSQQLSTSLDIIKTILYSPLNPKNRTKFIDQITHDCDEKWIKDFQSVNQKVFSKDSISEIAFENLDNIIKFSKKLDGPFDLNDEETKEINTAIKKTLLMYSDEKKINLLLATAILEEDMSVIEQIAAHQLDFPIVKDLQKHLDLIVQRSQYKKSNFKDTSLFQDPFYIDADGLPHIRKIPLKDLNYLITVTDTKLKVIEKYGVDLLGWSKEKVQNERQKTLLKALELRSLLDENLQGSFEDVANYYKILNKEFPNLKLTFSLKDKVVAEVHVNKDALKASGTFFSSLFKFENNDTKKQLDIPLPFESKEHSSAVGYISKWIENLEESEISEENRWQILEIADYLNLHEIKEIQEKHLGLSILKSLFEDGLELNKDVEASSKVQEIKDEPVKNDKRTQSIKIRTHKRYERLFSNNKLEQNKEAIKTIKISKLHESCLHALYHDVLLDENLTLPEKRTKALSLCALYGFKEGVQYWIDLPQEKKNIIELSYEPDLFKIAVNHKHEHIAALFFKQITMGK